MGQLAQRAYHLEAFGHHLNNLRSGRLETQRHRRSTLFRLLQQLRRNLHPVHVLEYHQPQHVDFMRAEILLVQLRPLSRQPLLQGHHHGGVLRAQLLQLPRKARGLHVGYTAG
jgi:hypothetical protein